MNRLLFLVLIALLTFVIIYAIMRPDVFKDFWLWIVGLAGPIIKFLNAGWSKAKQLFQRIVQQLTPDKSSGNEQVVNEQ